ncbi:hypothetical protein CDAR_17301 [Caerostris darwini]|uniref:Uncharacterized protein n=1 Tax=Caerostris darwini TaxID=1538125 RepID=A0AAV4M556_9ARAC|nr:hypothetical protein CDAR_17301 [Caerostris darwini]
MVTCRENSPRNQISPVFTTPHGWKKSRTRYRILRSKANSPWPRCTMHSAGPGSTQVHFLCPGLWCLHWEIALEIRHILKVNTLTRKCHMYKYA